MKDVIKLGNLFIGKYINTMDCEKWSKHQLERIREAKRAIIPWNFAVQTDWKIKTNRPDIEFKDYEFVSD